MGAEQWTRILGIDPGTHVVGFGCLEVPAAARGATACREAGPAPLAWAAGNVVRAGQITGGRPRVVEAGVLRLGGSERPIEDRLFALQLEIVALLARVDAHELAVEEAFHGRSVAAALRIGEARGVVLASARAAGLAVFQFAPARVKRAVAGHGRATKDAVAAMVERELGALPPGPRDVSDALAVAYCRVQQRASSVG